jgi:hypothetical protein
LGIQLKVALLLLQKSILKTLFKKISFSSERIEPATYTKGVVAGERTP